MTARAPSSPSPACAPGDLRLTPTRSTSPTPSSSGRWRELLEGAGVKRASVSGTGVFKDQASDALLRQVFFDGLLREWQIVIPGFGVLAGLFQISNLDYRGEHAGEVTFDISLELAGALAFTAL